MKFGKIFITGGGGYIGSHVAKFFLESGFEVVVFENFSTGFYEPLEILKKKFGRLKYVKGDLRNFREVYNALKRFKPRAVMHLAASCSVDESMKRPDFYFENNVQGTMNLLKAMKETKVKQIIFSSTCAVYGEPNKLPVKENEVLKPINFYGKSKLLSERLIEYFGQAGSLEYIIFRFFNVCGASRGGSIGDGKKPSSLLVQNVVRGAMGIQPFKLTYPVVDTPDKTPIRDYIDVEDLARAHLSALEYLDKGGQSDVFNLGNGKGFSVKQIINAVSKELSIKISSKNGPIRKGEYAKIFADSTKAKKNLGFVTKKTLKESIQSLNKWYAGHPRGYRY